MKTTVWTLPTRAFHWFLAFGFLFAWFSGDFEYFQNLHYAFGAYVGMLLFLRILFGIVGPRYSRFSDFPIGWKQQVMYIRSISGRIKEYAGHNPVASVIMILMILSGIAAALSGYFYYTALVRLSGEMKELPVGNLHHFFSTLFLILVGLHLAGLVADTLLRRDAGNLRSMFSGNKPLQAENADLSLVHKLFALVWLVLPFYFFYLAYHLPA